MKKIILTGLVFALAFGGVFLLKPVDANAKPGIFYCRNGANCYPQSPYSTCQAASDNYYNLPCYKTLSACKRQANSCSV